MITKKELLELLDKKIQYYYDELDDDDIDDNPQYYFFVKGKKEAFEELQKELQ